MFYAVVAGLKAPRCDIVLASSPSLFVGLAGYLLSRLRRVPLVLEVRDLWPETAVVMGVLRRPLLIRLATWLAHFLYRSADRVIALTEGIRDGIINAGIPASKIVFVPNGVDDEPFAELSPERAGRVRERYGWGDRFVAIYVGTLAASDGLPAIVCAAKLLRAHKDVLIVFLGDGEVKTKLEAMVADHGLANVMFIPSQPKADVPDFIGAADVCLLPVKNHPFFAMTLHNKLFDYMADARPILAALPEGEAQRLVCTAGAGIAVPPEDEVRLTTALLELRADREARRRYGENGRAYVMAHYRRSHLAGRLAATLDAALDAKRGKTTYAAERHHLSSSQTDQ
jgi:glycosyltransferase involved in cell wall biosynthesis